MGITRRLPNSNLSRQTALSKARARQTATPVPNQFLTASTVGRLNTVQTAYNTKWLAIPTKESLAVAATQAKDAARSVLETYMRAFYDQVLHGIRMGKLDSSVRNMYGLQQSSDAFPNMDTEDDVINAAAILIAGEAARVAAGGTALTWPTGNEIETRRDTFLEAIDTSNNADEALDTAQETLESENEEADKVIKKVWDEVETHFNEEDPASLRASARPWGVVYITTAGKTTVTASVVDEATGLPVDVVTAEVQETGEKETLGPDGLLNKAFEAIEEGHMVFKADGYAALTKDVDYQPNTTVPLGQVRLVHL